MLGLVIAIRCTNDPTDHNDAPVQEDGATTQQHPTRIHKNAFVKVDGVAQDRNGNQPNGNTGHRDFNGWRWEFDIRRGEFINAHQGEHDEGAENKI